jgi:hypothetical protein
LRRKKREETTRSTTERITPIEKLPRRSDGVIRLLPEAMLFPLEAAESHSAHKERIAEREASAHKIGIGAPCHIVNTFTLFSMAI